MRADSRKTTGVADVVSVENHLTQSEVDLDLEAGPGAASSIYLSIYRRERPHRRAQLTFTDHNGYRFQVFISDQTDATLPYERLRNESEAGYEACVGRKSIRRPACQCALGTS